MRVLNVNMSIDPVTGGGTAERIVKIAKYLSRRGVKSSLLTSDIGVDEKLRNSLSGVELHVMPNLNRRYYLFRFSIKHLEKIVEKSDVVHLMNHWTAINATVYKVCRQLNKPYVVCPAGALIAYGRSLLLKKMYNRIVGNNIIKNAARHVAIPAEEAYQFKHYGIEPASVEVIPNGIDPEDFTSRNDAMFRQKHSLGENPFILFMGRLNAIKGPDLLLDAFSTLHEKFPDYHMVFAGPDGGMLESLKTLSVKQHLQEYVHFIGYVGGIEKSHAYHAAELLAIPSRKEAMSIVALEAGITGIPVLLTDVCGFNQVEKIGGGTVVKPDVDDIHKGLSTLLEDRENLTTKGELLKDYVLKNYTWDSVIQKYIDMFKNIIS
ncbi:glycosyltransferase [Thermodesulfobacteriota bacterium]